MGSSCFGWGVLSVVLGGLSAKTARNAAPFFSSCVSWELSLVFVFLGQFSPI